MRIAWFASIAAFFACTTLSTAQSSKRAWAFGIHPGMYSFYAVRPNGGGFFNPKNYGGGVELSLSRYLSKAFDAGLETGFGRVRHPLDSSATDPTAFGIRDNFFTLNLAAKFKFDNGFILKQDFPVAPFIKAGLGVNSFGDFKRWAMYFPVGIGLNIRIPKTPIVLTVQTSYNIGIDGNSFAHHSFGMQVEFGKEPGQKKKQEDKIKKDEEYVSNAPDRDYDGVPDEEDKCPEINGSKLAGGCPDTDSDGVQDTEDKCPEEKGFANLAGCQDKDYDGVIDPDDKCPDEYGEGEFGCADIKDPNDVDGDGVPNTKDLCPDESGMFTASGCPDSDGDGIRDTEDLCADFYGVKEHKGCPIDKAEMDRLKKMYGDPDNPDYTVNDKGQRVDKNGNLVDPSNHIITNHGYKTNKEENKIVSMNGATTVTIDKSGNLVVNNNGPAITALGGYRLDTKGNLVDRDGGIVRMDAHGNVFDGTGRALHQQNNHHHGGNHGGNGDYPKNPGVLTDPVLYTGYNPDATGNGGGIIIGNPWSDAPKDKLTGWEAPQELTPEEEEYCQRIDLTALRSAIFFPSANANVHPEAYSSLNSVVEAMRKCAVLELQIAGHADADGGDSYNLQLSEERAQAVLKYITGQGISEKRLKYNAYGEKYPIAPNDTDANKQVNRRAEIRVQRTY